MQQGHGTTAGQAAGSIGALCPHWVVNKVHTHDAPSARNLLRRTFLLLTGAG